MTLPLDGVRVVALEQLIAVPHASKLLADMGAEVIHVESCVRMEVYRETSVYRNDPSGAFWNRGGNFYEQNRNKLGLTLDLNKPAGLAAMKELISISDVFIENFTPRVVKNFGLEYEDLRRIRPDIIVAYSTGYGYDGPWSSYGAIGFTTEAASGLAHMTGYKDGPPVLPEIPYADYAAAELTTFAVMAALVHRARTGRGQSIDLSHTEAVSSTMPEALMDYTANGRTRERLGNRDQAMAPHGCYPCRGEDTWIAIAIATDAQWAALCRVLSRPEWVSDARFADGLVRWRHQDELDSMLSEVTRPWDQYDLMHTLQEQHVPAGAVLNGRQLLLDPHLKERRFYETTAHHPGLGIPVLPYTSRPWKMSMTQGGTSWAAPLLGEHNRLVLTEMLGIPAPTVSEMEAEGVIGEEPAVVKRPPVIPLEDHKRQGRIFDYDEDFQERIREAYGE